ncbi:hypothetical protein N0V93_005461 [Gnomoniopsis smithogilvyi]|uniref:Uncharacterized protein n=1 Tax=Gnomoniopsis smithogilvyi TaxID=1191159 RepID=A0A9W8YSW8_9PEZI|nr:hypothetical protein N0V93_005461 [Gnomoniopsis smithogilvyi]
MAEARELTCTCPIPEGANELHNAFEKSGGAHLTLRDGNTLTSYNRSVPSSPIKEPAVLIRLGEATPSKTYAQAQKKPDLEPESQHADHVRHPAPTVTSFSKPRAPRKSSASVKDNPFIVADRTTPGISAAAQQVHTSQAPRRTAPFEHLSRRSDSGCHDEPCSDPACRATHSGYRPYRHRVGCTSRRTEVSPESYAEDYEQSEYRSSRQWDLPPPARPYIAEPERIDWYEELSSEDEGRYRREPTYHAELYGRHRTSPPRHYVVREPAYYEDHTENRQPRSRRVREATHHDEHVQHDPQPRRHARERTYHDDRPIMIENVYRPRHEHKRERTRHDNPREQAYVSAPLAPRTRQHQRSETHERYHQHPHSHSPNSQNHIEHVATRIVAPPSEPEPVSHHRQVEPEAESAQHYHRFEPAHEQVSHTSPARSKDRPNLSHSKSVPAMHKANQGDRNTEDFREVRSRLKKTSSNSPSKPPVKLGPDPPPRPEHDGGPGHHSPPARLETTPKDEDSSPNPQEERKSNEIKGKEKEEPNFVRTKTDHTKCVEDNGWRPPAPIVRDHTKCIEEPGPAETPAISTDQNKPIEEPRGRTREQKNHVTGEAPSDHAARPAQENSREHTSRLAQMEDTDHECDWKQRYITLQADVDARGQPGNIGLEGLTIVLHMQGRDDLVINTDLRNLE